MKPEDAVQTIDVLTASLVGVDDKRLKTYGDALCLASDVLRAKLAAEKAERLRNPCSSCGAGWASASSCGVSHSCHETCEKFKAWEIAVDAEENKPLTREELWELAERCVGVYVANINGTEVLRGRKYCAAVLDISQAFGSMERHIQAIYGDKLTMWEDDYGKTWIAYRRLPKGA